MYLIATFSIYGGLQRKKEKENKRLIRSAEVKIKNTTVKNKPNTSRGDPVAVICHL